jgi:hypothetical protein
MQKNGHGRTPTDLAFGLTVLRRGDEILKLLQAKGDLTSSQIRQQGGRSEVSYP